MNFGRAFVGKGNRDALAANVVQPDLVFLLNALTQVLHRHVLLREFDFNRASLLLQIRKPVAVFAEAAFAGAEVRRLSLLLGNQPTDLRVHLFSVMLERNNLAARFLNFALGLFLASYKRAKLGAALFNHL